MITHDFFRLSFAEVMRMHKRSEIFRHPLYAVAELHDPLEPAVPFNMQAPLPKIESDWNFTRDAVPDYIQLFTGRAARERSLSMLQEEYRLAPAERFKRIESTVKAELFDVADPDTWDTGFFCAIDVPAELAGLPLPLLWCGNRQRALVEHRVRQWFFDPRSRILHGKEAVELARQRFSELTQNKERPL
jgi:hypothetical protein